jgi:hypothetical protein
LKYLSDVFILLSGLAVPRTKGIYFSVLVTDNNQSPLDTPKRDAYRHKDAIPNFEKA